MMMPTIAGSKNMCLKPSLACGAYVNPTGRCREPYLFKKSSKEQYKDQCKDQCKEQNPKFVCPPPKTDRQPGAKCINQKSAPADPCPPKAQPRNHCSKPLGPNISPAPKSLERNFCRSAQPANADPCKVNITPTDQLKAQSQQQVQPKQRSSPTSGPVCPCDCDKAKCESPRNMIKHSPGQQAIQQPNTRANPVCSPAQKRQQSPCGSSQKDMLTISINCSVSDKTNSVQLCVSENVRPGENEQKQEGGGGIRK